jgi:hypothetical protein
MKPEIYMTSFTPSVPETTTVSALTLARGRAAHLRNVILGLTRQTRQPDELVIGVMQDTLYDDLPQTDFPIRQVQVTGRELPLSRARNTVAAEAMGDCLVGAVDACWQIFTHDEAMQHADAAVFKHAARPTRGAPDASTQAWKRSGTWSATAGQPPTPRPSTTPPARA